MNLEQEPDATGKSKANLEPVESEANITQATDLLERPKDGSFLLGLQVFVAWVNSVLADERQP